MKVEKSAKIDGYETQYLGKLGIVEIYTHKDNDPEDANIYLVTEDIVLGKLLVESDSVQNCGVISGIKLLDLTKEKTC